MKRIPASRFIHFALFIMLATNLFAQNPPEKYGKISVEELENTACPIDSNAHAFFLFDYGTSYFEYADTEIHEFDSRGDQKGFQLFFKRHCRIKILDNQGFSWADFEIPLYHDEGIDEEKIMSINACAYNLENGKIAKTKLKKSDVFSEETNKYWTTKKFAMPNVREGSVIEIEYTIKSDYFFNLRPWYFQRTIPVLQSEYHVSIPEYFNFNQTQRGYIQIQREEEHKQKRLTITYHAKALGIIAQKQTSSSTFDYYEYICHYYAKDIPAFEIEEHLRTKDNYLSRFEFELQWTQFPNAARRSYTSNWDNINGNLLDHAKFGEELNTRSHIKNDAATLKQSNQQDYPLLSSAFNFIKGKMAWNGYYSKYVTTSLSEAYKSGRGNCADINLNLLLLLRELGFDAYPVILSTQENGIINPALPSISSFNYVITVVKLDKDTLLMDASDPYAEINILPVRCLNDKGRIVDNTGGHWILLMDYKPYSLLEYYKIDMDENRSIHGVRQLSLKDYAKYQYKKSIKKHNNISEYQSYLEKEITDLKILDLTVTGLDTLMDNMSISIKFKQNNFIEESNDIAYFKPAYQPFVSKNPFKLEKRDYPVEFDYPYGVQQIYSITIPEKYSISDLPKALIINSPDGKLKYLYNISQAGNNITLMIKFSLNKTLFSSVEYDGLKDFYQLIIDKQNELIVLKKTE
ncbi:MAG: DUF3857 domain-containing protein [Bacteroidales bacterium]|jgi:transglutaminase-like putative cysteine protease|nr:DUF3857 domain-containing protein [Bacteroidales bacterium]